MKRRQAISIHAAGRRLHQLATLDMLDDTYRIARVTSPRDVESEAAHDRYLAPQQRRAASGHAICAPVTVTHIVDEVLAEAAQDGAIVVLVPPVTVTTGAALRNLLRSPTWDVRCAPPAIQPLHERLTSVSEVLPRATALALSVRENSHDGLLGRALWAMTSAQWMSQTAVANGTNGSQTPAGELMTEITNDIVQVSVCGITGCFEITDQQFDALTFTGASGQKAHDADFTADQPSFIVHAVRWPLLYPCAAGELAQRYLHALRLSTALRPDDADVALGRADTGEASDSNSRPSGEEK